ncbi:helix-turn-helix domain-containing protein [Amaricoccus solimangrovi]|uniref:DNA binding HTH domain-containing protein n=1 Tax=Amaricoccus solimangrovi TaxID=2589815 RepID=A0A501WZP9_9RHOB|nr:helix-turn-helix domain-containing protein [Amaricoccus solimangrovi]TPE52611.1 hypothetical protein FJM51_05380 [Amaricoccus solimangrovi]
MSAPCVVKVDVAGKTFDEAIREFESRLIAEAMRANRYRKVGAARFLGISLDRLHRRIAKGG